MRTIDCEAVETSPSPSPQLHCYIQLAHLLYPAVCYIRTWKGEGREG